MNGQPGNLSASRAGHRRQRGVFLPFFAVGAIGVVAMAGLLFDVSHAYTSKTKLQNALDAAALAGAKVLDLTQSTARAREAAAEAFTRNAGEAANGEIAAGGTLTIQFSHTLNPFTSGTTPPQYVRVRGVGFDFGTWFAGVVGIDTLGFNGSAVAGPTPTLTVDDPACNIAPMMVCGDPDAGITTNSLHGYSVGEVQTLKYSANPQGGDSGTSATSGATGDGSTVGPGNFHLVRLGDNTGGADVRDALAGEYDACTSGDDVIETEPGNTIGPVAQGLNTRLGIYQGPVDRSLHRPDKVTRYQGTYPDFGFRYPGYTDAYTNQDYDEADGVEGRRILVVPIGDCSEVTNGQGQVPLLGYGCFFLLAPVSQKGNEAEVYGEFIEGCSTQGVGGNTPNSGPGPYKIVLHKDPDSPDS